MANYFIKFPKTYYSFDDNKTLTNVMNITSRFSLEDKLKENTSAYYDYVIKDGDTPEIIAYKIYGSSERHWIILAMNDILDPQFDWPMSYETFIKFVDNKYMDESGYNTNGSGLEWSRSNTHSYYKTETYTLPGNIVNTQNFEIDYDTYMNFEESSYSVTLPDGTIASYSYTKSAKNYYEYEYDLNESKRTIKLLRKELVSALEEEFRKVFL